MILALHTLVFSALMLNRHVEYLRKGLKWYLTDFCYIFAYVFLAWLWLSDAHYAHRLVTCSPEVLFAVHIGVNAFMGVGVFAWRNALLITDISRFSSFYLHSSSAIIFYLLRYKLVTPRIACDFAFSELLTARIVVVGSLLFATLNFLHFVFQGALFALWLAPDDNNTVFRYWNTATNHTISFPAGYIRFQITSHVPYMLGSGALTTALVYYSPKTHTAFVASIILAGIYNAYTLQQRRRKEKKT